MSTQSQITYKTNLKWIINLSPKPKNYKTSRETEKYLWHLKVF